ncbi:MAG: beta-N-acetylhexosaminidase [Acidiferrobacterales bacterium]|nr:beta-N-acetylhexosaminidase [Acidiferrobacterales bacterium]
MLSLGGLELTPAEREYLRHPLAGGIILFERNYESLEQLSRLIEQIHAAREPRLLVAVDQEGGRVQRFCEPFTTLPAARVLGRLYDENPKRAKRLAQTCGWLMASELRAVGVDLSLVPVLDLDRGVSTVIGDRAFHADPEVVAALGHSYMTGMAQAGMAATGKHFPGHGSVTADSHVALPYDHREYMDIYTRDMVAFERMIHYGLAAIMTAHVVYPHIDRQPASFSGRWIKDVLRGRLGFQGAVFSDDLMMAGAKAAGKPLDRARAALDAGCDMVLVCNSAAAMEVLDGLSVQDDPVSHMRLVRMHGRHALTRATLIADPQYQQACDAVLGLG